MNTRNIIKVLVAVFLGAASICQAIEGTWTIKTDMPTARICPSTAVVDGKIYAIGGGRSATGGYLATVEMYDPTYDRWTRKADMPTARNGHAVSVVNDKIYAIGGEPRAQASLGTVEVYEPSTNTWTRKTDMPTKRTFLSACSLDGKIYAFGGVTAGGPGGNSYPKTLEVYDPVTDTWARKSDMLTARSNAAACMVGGKIYLIGGTLGELHQSPTSNVDEYDPMTDTWTRKANMPTPRTALSASVVDGKIYAIGGGIWNVSIFSTVEMYDPATDTWIAKPDIPTQRILLSTSSVNGKIYAVGGSMQWYPAPGISTVEEYDVGLSAPQPDFNSDGVVDMKDLLKLIESWGQDDPIVDIAPPPFGDGIVDALDLELLMSYWKQPINDPTLIAHWSLDEAEGIIAYDSAGVNDAVVVGGTVWQPSGGQLNGALQLNGIDGYAVTGPVLNPAEGPFSVFAWVNGGAPGQAVLSQLNGANWLVADPDLGCVMTELIPPAVGRFVPQPLISEYVITDGQWHRIGFVWDGTNRELYVDDIIVAEDTQNNLYSSLGGLNIGCGSNSETGTFWSGLIDDVRIYNRAVRP